MAVEQNSCEQQAELICSFNHCFLRLTMELAGREERSLELRLKMDSVCILGGVHKNGAKTHLIHHCLIWAGMQMDRKGGYTVVCSVGRFECGVSCEKCTFVYLLPYWLQIHLSQLKCKSLLFVFRGTFNEIHCNQSL